MNTYPAIEEAIGGKLRVCEQCGKAFFQFERKSTVARTCPKCKDIRAENFSLVEGRALVSVYNRLTIDESFPTEGWEMVQTPDGLRYKLDRRGTFGQIVVWAKSIPQVGDVVNMRKMRSLHRLRKSTEMRKRIERGKEVEFEVVHRHHSFSEDGREDTDEHVYYVIHPTTQTPTGERLGWVRDEDYPLRVVNAAPQPALPPPPYEAYEDGQVYLSPSTIAKLMIEESEDN